MNPIIKSIAKPIYYRAQEKSLGKKSINLAFTFRKLSRKFKNPKEARTIDFLNKVL